MPCVTSGVQSSHLCDEKTGSARESEAMTGAGNGGISRSGNNVAGHQACLSQVVVRLSETLAPGVQRPGTTGRNGK